MICYVLNADSGRCVNQLHGGGSVHEYHTFCLSVDRARRPLHRRQVTKISLECPCQLACGCGAAVAFSSSSTVMASCAGT